MLTHPSQKRVKRNQDSAKPDRIKQTTTHEASTAEKAKLSHQSSSSKEGVNKNRRKLPQKIANSSTGPGELDRIEAAVG